MFETFCTNCGKALVKGVKKCGYCEFPVTEGIKKIEVEEDVSFIKTKKVIGIFFIILSLFFFLTEHTTSMVYLVVAYYILAPWGVKIAKERDGDPADGFICGSIFGLPGLAFYWVATKKWRGN